jgi:hypothetical protein
MGILLYFAFGVLNIWFIYLIISIYRRWTGIDFFPCKNDGNKVMLVIDLLAYFFCGPFGTALLVLLGIFLFIMWIKYYRKK